MFETKPANNGDVYVEDYALEQAWEFIADTPELSEMSDEKQLTIAHTTARLITAAEVTLFLSPVEHKQGYYFTGSINNQRKVVVVLGVKEEEGVRIALHLGDEAELKEIMSDQSG
jgi:hypothetical protein